MSYKPETIKKVLATANDYRIALKDKPIDEIKMCISAGNRKIGRVMNVSLMPILTCHNCKECKGYCYDIKACCQYPDTVINARMRNTMLMWRDREEYFARIDAAISRRRTNKYFRWHVAGDIVDRNYFARMVDIARRHPDFTFWTYTKMYWIVNEHIERFGALPENLHVMFSKWDGLPMDNPHNLPVFACRLKEGNKDPFDFEHCHKCPGNCDICKAAGRGCVVGETSFADEH